MVCDGKYPFGTGKGYNQCDNAVGDIYIPSNFCTLAGSHNDYRKSYCQQMSEGEWTKVGDGKGCNYSTCDEKTAMGSSCCGSCCPIVGKSVECKRLSFSGDNLLCCLRDRACHLDDDIDQYCFETTDKLKTCAPGYRDQSSTNCQDLLYDYCVNDPNDTSFFNKWLGSVDVQGQIFDRPCYKALYRNLYAGNNIACGGEYLKTDYTSAAGFNWTQKLMVGAIERYTNAGYSLDNQLGQPVNLDMNSMFWNICYNNPGVCQRALRNYCVSVTPDYIERRLSIRGWCSCYMQDEFYSKYTNLYGVPVECSPLCNATGVIPLAKSGSSGSKKCNQSICLIDDTSINIAESTVGSISFSQVCSSCTTGSCQCIISNNSLYLIDQETGSLSISQECIGNSKCYRETEDPTTGVITNVEIPCDAVDLNDNTYSDIEEESKQNQLNAVAQKNWTIIIIFFILFVVLVFAWYIFAPTNTIYTKVK
jgi:hypothetical protein